MAGHVENQSEMQAFANKSFSSFHKYEKHINIYRVGILYHKQCRRFFGEKALIHPIEGVCLIRSTDTTAVDAAIRFWIEMFCLVLFSFGWELQSVGVDIVGCGNVMHYYIIIVLLTLIY